MLGVLILTGPHTARSEPLPARDPVSLAQRYGREVGAGVATESGIPAIGDRSSFFVLNQRLSQYLTIEAELRHVSGHACWWVQMGESVEPQAIEQSAAHFESSALDTVLGMHGLSAFPMIAGAQRVHIVNARVPGAGAYFSSIDAFTRSVHPYSNERGTIIVNLSAFRPGTGGYQETLTHELQHLVSWTSNPAGETWLDEGMAELAASMIRGRPGRGAAHTRQPDRPLTLWADEPGVFSAQYDGAYLFAQYIADRFGVSTLGDAVRAGRGLDGLDAVMTMRGAPERSEDIVSDWMVANLSHPERPRRPRQFRYQAADPGGTPTPRLSTGTDSRESVTSLGADYLEVAPEVSVIEIHVDAKVPLTPSETATDELVWWSRRADSLNATMTRSIDLRSVREATLKFRSWYRTEAYYDHGYVAVSRDGGVTWQALTGTWTVEADPTGNAFGPAYTGQSGADGAATWVHEEISLTPFAGQEVLLRFEYVTDQGTALHGWLIDDIEIPEIGLRADVEDHQTAWTSRGFIRLPAALPARLLVQVVHGDGPDLWVERHVVTESQPLRLELTPGAPEPTVLILSGRTPHTVEPMGYSLSAR